MATILRLACFVAVTFAGPIPMAPVSSAPDARLFGSVRGAPEDLMDALDPAQVDPDDITRLIVAHPLVPDEYEEQIGAAVNDLHAKLTELHANGLVEPGDGRYAAGLEDFINSAIALFEAHIEQPLNRIVADAGAQLDQDFSPVVPAVKSTFAYLADLLGAAAIFLRRPSAESMQQAFGGALSAPQPDVAGVFQKAMASCA